MKIGGMIERTDLTLYQFTSIEDEPGTAVYAWLPVAADGTPQFDSTDETILSDLLPYGAACFEVENTDNLKHPKLFVDPQSRIPHIFLSDYLGCAFQIMELRPVVVDIAEDLTKRRRQIIILRHRAAIALRPNLPLAKGTLVVGSGLRVLMHWDAEIEGMNGAVNYLELDEYGVSETKVLSLDEGLDHERAVELIRELAQR